jgi:hypothetical protein
MNTDTNRPDDPYPDDLDGLAASLDYLRLWCEADGAGDSLQGPANAGRLLSCTRGLCSKRGALRAVWATSHKEFCPVAM